MQVPSRWLVGRKRTAEAEEALAEGEPSDLWLQSWWSLLDRMEPGDQLWEFKADECPGPGEPVDMPHAGYAVVRAGRVVDAIDVPWMGGPAPH
ncbi:hypothetical protein [Tautonia plasticadhaerens]|uniref:Uncharacterized protein n=1 Tax=Tautonia plasticadhaerens TaxID=2527974 RepID=A0A518GZ58_9BACT|nr:hypothetical protein [Tautonia plasticadhaerens]QDV33885.1 hypothetical protein ElP_17650 [Tautonia plasticadhaerens]